MKRDAWMATTIFQLTILFQFRIEKTKRNISAFGYVKSNFVHSANKSVLTDIFRVDTMASFGTTCVCLQTNRRYFITSALNVSVSVSVQTAKLSTIVCQPEIRWVGDLVAESQRLNNTALVIEMHSHTASNDANVLCISNHRIVLPCSPARFSHTFSPRCVRLCVFKGLFFCVCTNKYTSH